MKLPKETEQKIFQLQLLEQNMQQIAMQKQTFQAKLLEVNNALEEIKNTEDKIYKVVGNIMVLAKKDDTEKDLKSKKEILDVRFKNLESQEKKIKEKAEGIQKEVLKKLEK